MRNSSVNGPAATTRKQRGILPSSKRSVYAVETLRVRINRDTCLTPAQLLCRMDQPQQLVNNFPNNKRLR